MNFNFDLEKKTGVAKNIIESSIEIMKVNKRDKVNLIWLEATGCSGNIISLLNANNPSVIYFLDEMVNLTYNNSLMAKEGEQAFDVFLDTLNKDFILIVEGAISTRDNGLFNVIARHNGKLVTAMEAVKLAASKAKYVIAVGTCASYGGPTAAKPNVSESISVFDYLDRQVIRVPGCPSHPDWVIGTIASLIAFDTIELDSDNRPVMFYGLTIHDRCTRRSFFNNGIFAKKLGEKECQFKLGCRGPVTKADCPVRQWNGYVNWPIEDNTPCIGCTHKNFPDGMEPFVRY